MSLRGWATVLLGTLGATSVYELVKWWAQNWRLHNMCGNTFIFATMPQTCNSFQLHENLVTIGWGGLAFVSLLCVWLIVTDWLADS